MKKFIVSLLFLTPIYAFCGQYLGIHGGGAYPYNTDDSRSGQKVGYKVGAVYGYVFDSQFRAEMELTYRNADRKTVYSVGADDQLKTKEHRSSHGMSYMANLLYDINQITYSDIIPYFGIGLGYCENVEKLKMQSDLLTHETKEKDTRFAYQGIIGAKYPVSENMWISAEYHYFCGRPHAKDHSVGLMVSRSF